MKKLKTTFILLLLVLCAPQSILAATAVINDASGTVYEFSSRVAQDVDLIFVSVYEADSGHGGGSHPMYPANVTIEDGGSKPIVLLLSSYEPVRWDLTVAPGIEIREVILNGYHEHDFTGVDPSLVTNKSGSGNYLAACGYSYPYSGGGCDTSVLIDTVEDFIGLSLSIFAGTYNASDFTVTSGGVQLIDITSNAGTFTEGETINATLSISNSGSPINADVLVSLQLPDGSLYHPLGNPAMACGLIPYGELVTDLPLLNYTFPAGHEGQCH